MKLLAPLLLLAAAGCGRSDTVRIAVVFPLTGDMGAEGQGLRRGVELAVEQANAAKRLPYRLEVAAFDDRADPKEAVSAANMAISDPKIVAAIAHYNSGCAIPAAKIYARGPMAMITPAATNAEVTAQQLKPGWEGPRVAFRVCPTSDVQSAFAAEFIRAKLGKKRVSVVDDKTAYGQGVAEGFKQALAARGGTIVTSDGIATGDKDFRALLTRIRAAKPDAVYYGGLYPEAGLMLRQMRELGMRTPFFTSDGSKTPGFFDVAGDAAEGAYVTIGGTPVEKVAGARGFVAAYQARYGSGDALRPYDHYGYLAANVLIDALAAAGPDRLKVIEALRRTRHQGILGLTTFDEKGDAVGHQPGMTIARAKERTFELQE